MSARMAELVDDEVTDALEVIEDASPAATQPLDEDDMPLPPCYCGRRGCIETYLSGPGLAADHARRTGERARRRCCPPAPSASRRAPRRGRSSGSRYSGLWFSRWATCRARGKAWPANEPEPGAWMIERIDPIPNRQGAPGIFGNGLAELYFDNIKVYANK